MKPLARLVAGTVLVLAAGCATTPADRISANQAEFNSWPPPVQAAVRAGQPQAGFTPEMVRVALGEPSLKTVASGAQGVTEVWIYHRRAPRLSIGVGGGGYSGHTAVAGGVSANGIKLGEDEDGRVIFTNGYVTEVVITSR